MGQIRRGLVDAVTINVHNHADHPLRVTSAGLTMQDGSGATLVQPRPPPGATLPGTIPPHDSAMTYFYEEHTRERGFDLRRPVEAWATLSTGDTFKSESKPLLTG
jgi:hypothetical protein